MDDKVTPYMHIILMDYKKTQKTQKDTKTYTGLFRFGHKLHKNPLM